VFGLSRELKYENKVCWFLVVIRNGDKEHVSLHRKRDYPKLHTFKAEKPQFMWNAATEEETQHRKLRGTFQMKRNILMAMAKFHFRSKTRPKMMQN